MPPTRTPGQMYVVNQHFPSLRWRVVPVPEGQGQAMRERKEPHVYDTSAQAYAIVERLNNPSGLKARGALLFPEHEPTPEVESESRDLGIGSQGPLGAIPAEPPATRLSVQTGGGVKQSELVPAGDTTQAGYPYRLGQLEMAARWYLLYPGDETRAALVRLVNQGLPYLTPIAERE